jgi:type II protein arginine methyltransferase
MNFDDDDDRWSIPSITKMSLASIATLFSQSELSQASISEGHTVLKLVEDAESKGYQSVCIPLTTQRWKARWEDMCLASPAPSTNLAKKRESRRDSRIVNANQRDAKAEKRAEQWRLRPVFERDEVTITQIGL